jgi:hypothetical protein
VETDKYTNSLGEVIQRGTRIYFYKFIIKTGAPELVGTKSFEFCLLKMLETSTEAALTPSGAIIMLDNYYKQFGYPN